MLIKIPNSLCYGRPSPDEFTAMANACEAIVRDLGMGGACGVNAENPLEWSNTFAGPVPELDDLVRVAEAHGYDVLWGIERFGPMEWAASFRKVEARDPEVIKASNARFIVPMNPL